VILRLKDLIWLTVLLMVFSGATLYATVLPVNYLAVKVENTYQYLQKYAGRISSEHTSNLGFELPPITSGTIVTINVDTGDKFKKGTILAKLDDSMQKLSILELQAKLKEAQINLELAKLTTKRLERLKKQDFASLQGVDNAIARQKTLRWQIQALDYKIKNATIMLGKYTLIAPFDGTVIKRAMSEGALFQSGQSVFTVIDNDDYQVNIGVPVRYLKYIKADQKVSIIIDGKTIQGTVKSINTNRNPQTQSHNVLINAHTKDFFIANQALATINLPIKLNKKGVWVPISALQKNYRGLWSVFYLKPAKNNRYLVTSKTVKVLFFAKEKAYIQTSMKNGQKIVSDGLMRIVPGEFVKLGHKHE
jgi:RND family efflux transporter MFP subunit